MRKLFKWSLSFLRLIKYKLIYGKKIVINTKKINELPYIGKNVEINLHNNSKLEINKKLYLDNYVRIEVQDNAIIEFGNNVYINEFSKIISMKSIVVGNDSFFGPNVSLYDHDHKIINYKPLGKEFDVAAVKLHNNIWVCANSVITKGVEIVDCVVIGANSVVTKSISESGLYAGLPAKKIK